MRRLSLLGLVAVLGVMLGAAPAFGWTVQRSSDFTLDVSREATTTQQDVLVYVSGGFPNTAQYADGSAASTATGGRFNGVSPTTLRFLSGVCNLSVRTAGGYAYLLALPDGSRYVFESPHYYRRPVVLSGQDGAVTLPNQVTVPAGVLATITAMPAVSLSSSISVDGTLPVTVESVGKFDATALDAVGVLAVVALGITLVAGLERRRHG